jgi:hypothetical protein
MRVLIFRSVNNVEYLTDHRLFLGIAIYYMAPLWPYTVTTVVTIDGGPPQLTQMTDPLNSEPVGGGPTVNSAVLWGQTGLADVQHTLLMSLAARCCGCPRVRSISLDAT